MSNLTLSEIELDRLLVLKEIKERFITQKEAAERLGLSERQVRRLLKRWVNSGSVEIRSKHNGGNRAFTGNFKLLVLNKVRERYHDFGPTFAAEKLNACEGLKLNRETLRQWMMAAGIWKGRTRKKARGIHPCRERRARFGELVQIDGSHHDWFERRGPKCCLLVFVDDATSRIIGLHFSESETTLGYMCLIQQHLKHYGRPLAYYSDKHSVFKVTKEKASNGKLQDTQLHRALKTLQIELICAHSSQAKGRVERNNQTLQDRLVKEMRLRGINSIEAANAFTPEFLVAYNKRFSVEPANPEDAHRPVYHSPEALKRILSVHTERTLSKNLEFSLECTLYQITTPGKGNRLKNSRVKIYTHIDGSREVLCADGLLAFKALPKQTRRYNMANVNDLNDLMDQLTARRYRAEMESVRNSSSISVS